MLKYISNNYYSEYILLKIKDHNFILSPNKTIFWQNKSILLISDLHVGGKKSLSTTEIISNFERAIAEFDLKEIIILGDLFDATCTITNRNIFSEFLRSIDLKMTLILGNHDKLPQEEYLELGISTVTPEMTIDMFILTHKPVNSNQHNIHGHLHPGLYKRNILIKNRLPCFVVQEDSICLPAFGGITGKNKYSTNSQRQVYIIKNNLIKLS